MKKLAPFIVLLSISSFAAAEVSIRVSLADGNTPLAPADANTPFVYRDIMVGTKLTIIVASDAAKTWDGVLYIEGIDRDYGVLSGRGYNAATHDWAGSRLPAAGQRARVFEIQSTLVSGFMLNSHSTAIAGDWFIIDYTARQVGSCRVALYENPSFLDIVIPPEPPAPILLRELVFSQAPTRDFDHDATVGLADFAILASYWGATNCTDPDRCQGTDLDVDGDVDRADLALFADYWLEKTQ